MSDRYSDFVSSGVGKQLAGRLGLPRPARLRRYQPGDALTDGPVLVAGSGRYAEVVQRSLSGAGIDVRQALGEGERLGGFVYDASALTDPAQLDELRVVGGPAVKALDRNARVVIIGRDHHDLSDPAHAATQRALEGIVRSLAKELRAGATANLVLATAEGADESVWAATAFFLSGRSAFVDGQPLRVGQSAGESGGHGAASGHGAAAADGVQPLAGKVAVVTGAARGIGAAIAETFARDGAIVVCVDVPAAGDALARVANRVRGTALQLDVTAPDAGARIVEHARARHGGIDILVNNAGITRDKLFVNTDESRWAAVIDVNLRALMAITAAVTLAMQPGGRVLCVSSQSGIAGNRGQVNYAASKAGIIGYVETLARALAADGITVNAVAPGFIETEMTAKIPPVTREAGRRMSSLQQGGQPVDVAEALAFFAAPAADGITGQVLRVCGQSLLGA